MSVFAIGDLHLSHQVEKPMDIFGGHWYNHTEKLKANWMEMVKETDTVILPGDFSWATYLEQSERDFIFLDKLPGKKILLKGNHDYWWETVTKMKKFLNKIGVDSIDFLFNNSYKIGEYWFCGTKGLDSDEEDPKIINRETLRFKNSLDSIKEKSCEITAVFHYPPDNNEIFVALMNEYGVNKCIYGHIHGKNNMKTCYVQDGVEYLNVSADQIEFKPVEI